MLDYGIMFEASGRQFKWNSHSIGAFQKCPRYYQYAVVEGWQPRDKSVHLRFGGHYADAMQAYYLNRAKGMDRQEAIAATIRKALTDTWDYDLDEEGNPIPGTGQPWQTDHIKDRFTLIRTLVWYFEEYRDDIPVLQLNVAPAVELKFSLAVDNDYFFVGTLDRGISYNKQPWIMDQKTTSFLLGPKYFNSFSPNNQVSQYTFAGRMIFNEPVPGVLIDATQIAQGFSRFSRAPIYRTTSQLNEWYDTALASMESANTAIKEQAFHMNAESCGNYGGCAFRDICSKSPESRTNFLKGAFVQEKPGRLESPATASG